MSVFNNYDINGLFDANALLGLNCSSNDFYDACQQRPERVEAEKLACICKNCKSVFKGPQAFKMHEKYCKNVPKITEKILA